MDIEGTLGIKATLDISEMQKNVQKYVQNIDMMQDHTDVASQTVEKAFKRMQAAGAAYLSVDMAKRFASEMVSIYGTFQQLDISFKTMLQSGEKATKLMGELVNFAAITPFNLIDVGKGAKQLLAYGTKVENIKSDLEMLGNVAAGVSVPLGDIIYLYGTLRSQGRAYAVDIRQFAGRGIPIYQELAKVLNVNVDEVNELVEAGRVGFPQVEKAFQNMTNQGGMFFNLMQEQSKSVTGKISNLKDKLDVMFNDIGQENDGFINSAIDGASYLVERYKEVGAVLGSLIALYGIHKAALIAHAAYYNSIKKIDEVARLTAEANALKVLETEEIKAHLSKQNLVGGSTAYCRALKAEIEAKLESQKATLQLATAEYSSAQAAYKATLQRSLAAKQAIWRREADLMLAKAEGDQAKITLAQTELQKAIDERASATKVKKAAAIELAQKSAAKEAAVTAVNTTTTTLNTAGEVANTASKSFGVKVTNLLTAATARLNAVLAANVWTIVALGIAAVGYGIYKLITYQTDAEKAQEKLNKRVKEFNSETEAEQAEIDRLFGKLDGVKGKAEEYQAAKDAIIDKYGDYLKGLGDEIEKLNDVAAAYDAISAAARQAALDRAIADSTSTAQKDWAENQGKLVENLEKAVRDSYKANRKDVSEREISSIIQMIKADLKNGGALSSETQKIVDGLTKEYFVPTGIGAGYNETRNDVQTYVDRMVENNKLLEKTYKDIHDKLGYDTNQYINLTAKQISTDIANFNAALERVKKTGRNQMAQLHDGSMTNSMGEAEIRNHLRKLKEAQKKQKEKKTDKGNIVPDIKEEVKAATDEVTKLKQEIEDLRSGKTKVDAGKTIKSVIEAKEKSLKEAESKLATLTGNDKGTIKSKKQKQEEANRLKVENAERQRQIDELNQQNKEKTVQSELELAQAKIDAMDEGFLKEQAQIELNYKKAKADNVRRANEYVKAAQQAERIAWEKEHPDYKGKGLIFIPTTKTENDLSPENKATLESYDKTAFDAKTAGEKNLAKSLLETYQDYTDRRLAIEKKFNEDIAALRIHRDKYQKEGNTAKVQQTDRAIAQATKDKGEGLMRLDYEQLKKSPEYVRAFENLKQTSTETLSSLLSQLEEAKRTAAEVLNPEDLREYTSTIQSIVDELTERNPFQTIIAKKKELARAEQELAKAKKLLDATDKKGFTILADYNEKTGETVYTYLTATEALKKYNEAKDHVIKTDGELQVAEKKVSEQVGELANALKDIGGVIGGTSGEIISLMGDIYSFASLSMEGIGKLSSEAAKEMSALEKSSVILGIISAAIRLLHQLDSFIGDAHSQYEGYAEKIAEINRLTDAVNEYRIAALEARQAEESWFSEDSLGNLRHFRELHEEIADAYDEKANEKQAVYENEGGGGWLTSLWKPFTTLIDKTYGKVFGFNINKEYEEGTTKATDNLRIETRKKSKGFLGTGLGGKSQKTEDLVAWARKNGFGELFDEGGLINKEAGRAILEEYGEKLVGQTKETLEELLELREKYDEYIDQLHEYVNSMYEPLVDNFVDAIFDWLDTGKDALDSFRDYASDTFRNIARDMVKSLVISQIFGTGEDSFQNKINALYEQYSKGELTEEELNRKVAEETALLGKKAEEKLPVIQESAGVIMDTLEQVTGIDIRDKGGSTSQSSTSGYSSVASQESIDETNGRLTGVQMGVEELKVEALMQTSLQTGISVNVESIKASALSTNMMMSELRDLSLIANEHLENISKNTKELYGMNERLEKIEFNTRGLR